MKIYYLIIIKNNNLLHLLQKMMKIQAIILHLKKIKKKNHNFLNYVKFVISLLKMKIKISIYNQNNINKQNNIMD